MTKRHHCIRPLLAMASAIAVTFAAPVSAHPGLTAAQHASTDFGMRSAVLDARIDVDTAQDDWVQRRDELRAQRARWRLQQTMDWVRERTYRFRRHYARPSSLRLAGPVSPVELAYRSEVREALAEVRAEFERVVAAERAEALLLAGKHALLAGMYVTKAGIGIKALRSQAFADSRFYSVYADANRSFIYAKAAFGDTNISTLIAAAGHYGSLAQQHPEFIVRDIADPVLRRKAAVEVRRDAAKIRRTARLAGTVLSAASAVAELQRLFRQLARYADPPSARRPLSRTFEINRQLANARMRGSGRITYRNHLGDNLFRDPMRQHTTTRVTSTYRITSGAPGRSQVSEEIARVVAIGGLPKLGPSKQDIAIAYFARHQQTILEMAKLSEEVYDPPALGDRSIDGEHWELIDAGGQPLSGLKWAIYARARDDGALEVTLAFAGTDAGFWKIPNIRDWGNNIVQAFIPSVQYREAEAIARQLSESLKGQRVIFRVTGHSLGGGLASFISRLFGWQAFTFNRAPLGLYASIDSRFPAGRQRKFVESQSVHIGINGEALKQVSGYRGGNQVDLDPPPGYTTDSVDLHLMGAVFDTLDHTIDLHGLPRPKPHASSGDALVAARYPSPRLEIRVEPDPPVDEDCYDYACGYPPTYYMLPWPPRRDPVAVADDDDSRQLQTGMPPPPPPPPPPGGGPNFPPQSGGGSSFPPPPPGGSPPPPPPRHGGGSNLPPPSTGGGSAVPPSGTDRAGVTMDTGVSGNIRLARAPVGSTDILSGIPAGPAATGGGASGERSRAARLAVSLRDLQARLLQCERVSCPADDAVFRLGGLTTIDGATADRGSGDIVIFGDADGGPAIHTQDLAVALRNVVAGQGHPGCTINPDPDVFARLGPVFEAEGYAGWEKLCTSDQFVGVFHVPRESRFANVMVVADYLLKDLVSGRRKSTVPSVTARHLAETRQALAAGRSPSAQLGLDRFELVAGPQSYVYDQSGELIYIERLSVDLVTERQFNARQQKRIVGTRKADPVAESFAKEFSQTYDRVGQDYEIYLDLDALFHIRALAEIVLILNGAGAPLLDLTYLLRDYAVPGMPSGAGAQPMVAGRSHRETLTMTVSRTTYTTEMPSCGGVTMSVDVLANLRAARGNMGKTLRSNVLDARSRSGSRLSWRLSKPVKINRPDT